jgi:hypothetical protein
MNCDVTLSKEDFKTIHNTLWEMQYRGMSSEVGAELIRAALQKAYEQDHAAFERKHQQFDAVRVGAKLQSIWSIYEVDDLSQPHPYVGATEVCYRDHWGDAPVHETIPGPTWADLYTAADRCIARSGDGHHVFIEAFDTVANQPHQLRLTTGS